MRTEGTHLFCQRKNDGTLTKGVQETADAAVDTGLIKQAFVIPLAAGEGLTVLLKAG